MASKEGNELQERAMEFELLRQQLAALQQEVVELQNRSIELDSVNATMEGIKDSKEKEMMVPVGGGILINSKLNGDKVLVSVGENVLIEKKIDDAKIVVDDQLKKITDRMNVLQKNAEYYETRMLELEPILQKLTQEQQSGKKKKKEKK